MVEQLATVCQRGDQCCKVALRHVKLPAPRVIGVDEHTWTLDAPSNLPSGNFGEIVEMLQDVVRHLPPCSADEAGRQVTQKSNGDIGRHMWGGLRIYYDAGKFTIGESASQTRLTMALRAIPPSKRAEGVD